MEFAKTMQFPVNFPVTRERAPTGVEFIDENGSEALECGYENGRRG